mmetsp:Transcript_21941/g.65569  ORF Transcript_21941/g.65569 Transcript_21941/m.65569 type:complete len:207 (-) Transcript_21941:1138-1758(-)
MDAISTRFGSQHGRLSFGRGKEVRPLCGSWAISNSAHAVVVVEYSHKRERLATLTRRVAASIKKPEQHEAALAGRCRRRRRPRHRPRAPRRLVPRHRPEHAVLHGRRRRRPPRRRAPPQRQLRRALSGIRHGERLPRRGRRHGDVAGGHVARRPRLRARRAARIAPAAGRRHFLQRPAARRRVLVFRGGTITEGPSEGRRYRVRRE